VLSICAWRRKKEEKTEMELCIATSVPLYGTVCQGVGEVSFSLFLNALFPLFGTITPYPS
jgi:hypothetical protein